MFYENKEIGELSLKPGCATVEWTIKDILSYTAEDDWYDSPTFSVPGSQWHLRVYPNRRSLMSRIPGWISLCLVRVKDSTYPKSVVHSFGVKKADGTVEERHNGTNVCTNAGHQLGYIGFLTRSELQKRKSELMPSDSLTVTCTMQVDDSLEATSALMKLSQDLKDVYISQRSSDATLRVQNRELSFHKAILGSRSPVFRSMFEVDMKEKNTGVVEIVDSSPEVFRDFLIYLYSGQFENNSKKDYDLYRVADKYTVEELKSECVRSMLSNLTISNVLHAAHLAHQFGENELRVKTQEFFNKNFIKIAASAEWNLLLDTNRELANGLLINMAVKFKDS